MNQNTPNLPTNIVDFRGFDSSRILILRGGILMFIGDLPEVLSQQILVGRIVVWRLGVLYPNCPDHPSEMFFLCGPQRFSEKRTLHAIKHAAPKSGKKFPFLKYAGRNKRPNRTGRTEPNRTVLFRNRPEPNAEPNRTEPDRTTTRSKSAGRIASNRNK